MNIKELRHDGRTYTNPKEIVSILNKEKFYWLIDSELSDAIIEIKNKTIIWHEGVYLAGDWEYGIFKNGGFYGNWINGIFEDGTFQGKWISGINLSKN